MENQGYIKEMEKNNENNINRRLQKLRAELEDCCRQETLKLKETCIKEVYTKYKNDLEQLKKELNAINCEGDAQSLNIIVNLNNKLQASEAYSSASCKELENCIEDFVRKHSEIDWKYRILVEELMLQLTNTEERARESKQEKECLNEDIEKLSCLIQELNDKVLLETEKNKNLLYKYDQEMCVYNIKLKDLQQEKTLLQEVLGRQKTKLEEMESTLCRYESELHLTDGEVDSLHDFRIDTLKNALEDARQNLSKVTVLKDAESFESDYYLKNHIAELELEAVTENTEKLVQHFGSTLRQEQSDIFNSPEHSFPGKDVFNTSKCRDVLEPSNGKVFSFNEEMHSDTLLQETLNETELKKSTALLFSGYSSPQNEFEEQNSINGHQIDFGIRDTGLIKQRSEKGLLFDKAFQEAGEEATAEVTTAHLKEQEACVGYDESLSRKMEKELEPENKRKQGDNSDSLIWVQEFKCAMQDFRSHSWEEMVKALQQEKENLMMQLRLQEQLVKDVQEQKTASDSVTSEVQSLFGRQLTVLQRQRDQMQAQLDSQMAKSKTLFELLGQKTIVEKFLLKEQEAFKTEIGIKEQNLSSLLKEKSNLEEKLLTVVQHLTEAEKALEESVNKIMVLEQTVEDLNVKTKSLQESNDSERRAFEEKLEDSSLELQKLSTEITQKEKEYIQKENELNEEVASLRNVQLELETRLEETLKNIKEMQLESERLHQEELSRTESLYLSELSDIKLQHQKMIEDLNEEIKESIEKQKQLEVERKEQIGIIKKLHEREHDREVAELVIQHEDEMKQLHMKLMKEQQQLLDELQQQMETVHEEEMQQAEALHNLKMEALKLSSNNVQTSQLELMQNNLRKEKEIALVELREMLNDKHAQELAVLQSRCQFELEHIKAQNLKEKQETTLKHQSDLDKEREKIALEMEEKHIEQLERLKREWALNTEISCKNMSEELSEKHQTELNEMERTLKSELEELKGKLENLSLEKEQVETEYKNWENQHQFAMIKLQTDCAQELQDVKEQSKKREEDLQQEIEKCQAALEKLKAESEEEIKQLWYQLDSARASRQELSELKEQLLARTSHMEEMENLKKDFQVKWDKKRSEHENELEQLRLYFEEKLKALEENYREELTVLHQKLQEQSLLEIENGQDEHMDLGPSVTLLEEMTEKERRDLFEQLTVQLEHHKEELSCLQLHLDKKHKNELELLRSSLTLQYQENLLKMKMDLSDRYACEIEELNRKHSLNLEQLRAKLSEEHLREMTKLRLQSAQDAARQIEVEVAERLVVLENEYKDKLDILEIEKESFSAHQEEIETLRRENSKLKAMSVQEEILWKDKLEQIKCKLIEDHRNDLGRAKEEIQEAEEIHRAKAEEWKLKWEDLNRKMEEKLLIYKELENQVECEKQALQKQFKLREAEMTWLQEQQASKISQLEKSLEEQQNNVQQLENTLANTQKTWAQYESELNSTKALMAAELEKDKQVFQEECIAKLEDAQNRFMEDSKAMTEKFAEEHEILLQELREKHIAELDLQRKELEQKHKEQILSLTADLQTQHQDEIETLKSTLEREQQIHLETKISHLQKNYQAQMAEIETKHLANLDTLESAYLSEIQLLRDEHRQAVEGLQVNLQEQLLQQDKANQELLAQNLARMKHKHAEELQVCQENLKIQLATAHIEELKIMAAELEEARKEDISVELEKQKSLLEHDYHKSLDLLRGEILHMEEEHKKAMQELQELHVAEVQKEREHWHRLQKEVEQQNSDKQQLEEKIKCLNKELEEANTELRKLQLRDKENQEREKRIALLRSDIELSKNEQRKLQETNQQALRLLLIMVKATKEIEGLICKKTGLCLDDSLASGDSRENHSIIGEMVLSQKMMEKWSMKKSERVHQGQGLEETLPEHTIESLVLSEMSELSEHLCESIFENPDLVFENEERINKICHALHIAVEKLLELLAESTKQDEEEFNRKNWEACQVVNEHHELMDCLNEESVARNQLELELHKARGLNEGCLAERDALEAALRLKEESEHRLVAELESMKTQYQDLTQEHTRCVEEQKLIISRNKALAANLGEREIDLLKEVERLSKAKIELQCQAEKDCSALNAQLKLLEIELEEQLNKNQKMAMISLEMVDLRQQIQALERQLKSQRDFMDKQAVEREHERDEFQEEIQNLEMQLRQTEKNQVSGQSRVLVESLYDEIKERTDDYNKLLLDKEQIQKELTVRNEEIEKLAARVRELERSNMEEAKNVNQLKQEIQKMKKMEAEWKQDKEALQQQQYNNLIQISTLQSKLDEIRHRVLPEESMDHILQGELKAQEELLTKKTEVANLLEHLKQFEESLISKNEEILQLHLKLEVEKNDYVSKITQLQEENAYLKDNTEKLSMTQNPGDSELALLHFLKSLLEEKNQETDHLNKQIVQLEYELESCKENKILERQMFEIEDLKSVIEHLHADKEQLVRDKSEEIEQLHGVIENLQKELVLREPVCDEINDSQDDSNTLILEEQEENFQNILQRRSLDHLDDRDGDANCLLLQPNQQELHGQLKIALADKEALQQLLEEKESQFKVEIKNLEQNLKNVQASSRQYFTELTDLQQQYKDLQEDYKELEMCLAQRNTEINIGASCIQELEGKLREREAKLSERELQHQAVSKQKAEQTAALLREKENVVQLENEVWFLVGVQRDKEVTYQTKISELEVVVAELRSQVEKSTEELETLRLERALFHEEDQNDDQKETKLHKLSVEQEAFHFSLEREERGEDQEPSHKPSVSVQVSDSDKLEKDALTTDLKTSSKNLNIQDKHLKGVLLIEELEVTNTVKEQQNLKRHGQQPLQLNQTSNSSMCSLNHLSENTQPAPQMPESFQSLVMDKTLWDSPEVMRKQNNSMELQASVPLTPFSEIDGTHSRDLESLCSESSLIQEESSGLLRCFHSYSNDNQETANSPPFQFPAFSGPTFFDTEYNVGQENTSARDAENFTLMPSELQDDLRSTMSRPEGASTNYGRNTSSDLVLQCNNENAVAAVHQDCNVTQCLGMVSDATEPGMKDKEKFSRQLKNVLKKVYEESYKILVLSEKNLPVKEEKNVPQAPLLEGLQRDSLTLLDAVQSLKHYLSTVPEKEDKEHSSAFVDWRGELLQAVQCVLEKERNMLQSYLQSHFCNSGSGDEGSLIEKLEHIAEQQDRQQKIVLEHLLSSDRNSLLTEIQDLQAQLRLMHLQNQEKLQQLQETLINTENHGSKQEHQLRRQVELLEYKLQQEKSIAGDLQISLKSEQEKASEMHKLLKQEHTAIMNLKLDLSESKKTNEKLQKSLQDLQKEVIQYSSTLESKEKSMSAVLQDLQNERVKEKELQAILDEQQQQYKKREDEKSKAVEELQAALELQCIQNNQLSVAIEHEQAANSNLRKELQIEHSRCEALLSQEQNKLLELQKNIDVEKSRSLELLSALNHERVLTEQLSMRINECGSCKRKEDSLQELQAQLSVERSHARELAAILEKTQRQALDSKKQMDRKQTYEEPEKEQDVFASLQITQASLQTQKQDIIHALEIERGKETQMKREWEHLQTILRSLSDQENVAEQGAKETKQEQQRALGKLKELQRAQESQLELQHRQNTGRIEELQHMLEELKEQEKCLCVHKNQHKLPSCPSKNCTTNSAFTVNTAQRLQTEQQRLDNIRGQLLFAAAYVSEFVYKSIDRTLNRPALSEETVATLLQILEELKAELLTSSRPLVTPTHIMNSMQESERIAWLQERAFSQNSLKTPEYGVTKSNPASENKSTVGPSNLKLQKLYRKYLRAESFRKALIYQKKYLLLLLGGFQECEQATLSLIARMGIYPSPPDLNVCESRSRPFTKFRSVVRVVIAISRLKFLVKKWHKVNRKEMPSETLSHRTGHHSYPRGKIEVLKQPQPFPDADTESPATRETGCCNRNTLMRLVNSSPKSPPHMTAQFTSSSSQASSKDPERSLAEYIAYLEAIQQRLGMIMPEPEKP
ncbi:pericentrin [Eublepharis macularius]|uniref:Pericentrin n=1 Tax=Eublepharis macularius TaxID=481883 RepID=A0AA97J674_EUBMA|nr:pericentrin [Eublepharis macularius]